MNGIRRVILLCLVIGGSLVVAGPVATATNPVRFGAVLNTTEFPDNAYLGKTCDNVLTGHQPGTAYSCTWIEDQALNAPGNGFDGAKAPKDGKINKIRLIAGKGGSFTLFVAHYNSATQQGKVVKAGPVITYATDPCTTNGTQCNIQTFSIDPLQVHKGDVLGIKTYKTSMLQCNQGSDHISLYHPALTVGGPLTTANGTDGCYLLLQAQYQ